ncbi:MAG: ATPase P [Chryseobacterium sp.]|nr:MAG: ATPase P [Chryseobacterium sp.]
MKFHLLTILLSVSILSCAQETPKVKQVKMKPKTDLKGIKVVNAEDPICHMKTTDFLKDTVIYKNKTYGFCSDHCKTEFKKNPAKYVKN